MPECTHQRAIEIIEQSGVPLSMINEFMCPECWTDLQPVREGYERSWNYREVKQ